MKQNVLDVLKLILVSLTMKYTRWEHIYSEIIDKMNGT